MKMLMCQPTFYGIYYEINPWMDIKKQIDFEKAKLQWQVLYDTVLKAGAEVELIEPVADLPDMVFTANAGLIYKDQVWVAQFKFPERQKESIYFAKWFEQHGFTIANVDRDYTKPPAFEGAGDGLFLGETLIVGYGFRSDKKNYEHTFFQKFPLVLCELVDPHFYHLDTCFCPLSSELAIWYPDAFSQETQKKLLQQAELISVKKEEAAHFACNAIVINKKIILPEGCPAIYAELAKRGFETLTCDMSEYIKAGGACKCLSLMLT